MRIREIKSEFSRIEQVDVDLCAKNVGGNKFNMILIASARAREIHKHNRNSLRFEHSHSAVTAMLEIQDGKIGAEYLHKV